MGKATQGGRKGSWRKDEIIDAAAECFMERGYQATTIDHVAARLNATKGRIYHHYATKTDLFFEVHRVGMEHLFEAIAPAETMQGTAHQRLNAMMVAHAKAMLDHHTYENVVAQGVQLHRFEQMSPEQRATLRELITLRDEFEKKFKAVLQQAMDEGSIDQMDVSITTKTLLGGLQWSIFWYRRQPNETPEHREMLARKMVEPFVKGL